MKLYDTAARRKRRFAPAGDVVRLYVCGPTVYAPAHLGHAKSYVAFDVLRRWLEYRGLRVRHVQNITDAADETAMAAAREGLTERELTLRHEADFRTQMAALGNRPPHATPRASEFADDIAAATRRLLAAGRAYETPVGVFLHIDPARHGQLLGVELAAALAQPAVEVDAGPKRSPHDFLLWGPPLPGGTVWKPEGLPPGRPGWHLECTLMASRELGLPLDLHCGGSDLVFPHHESEELLADELGLGRYCRRWMHNGLMEDSTGKLSKSRGDRVTLAEVFVDCTPAALRFYLLGHHYRAFTPYTPEALEAACAEGERLNQTAKMLLAYPAGDPHRDPHTAELLTEFEAAMDDDLDTPRALTVLQRLHRLAHDRQANGGDLGPVAELYRRFQRALGLFAEPRDAEKA